MNKTYINWLKADKKSEKTIKDYTRHIEEFLNWINKPEEEITKADIIGYRASISNYSSATVAIKVNAIKSYFRFLEDIGVIEENITAKIKAPKAENKVKPYITSEDISKLIEATPSRINKAIIATLASTGMRKAEISSITINQWNEMKNNGIRTITIVGKGNKERMIYINDTAMKYIEEYLACRDNQSYLFETNLGNELDDSNLNKMLKKSAVAAGLPYAKDLTVHGLRVACATIMNANGVDVPTISASLGHSSLAVTTRYIKTAQFDINNAMANIKF